ncbi:MAG TPA: alpha/beta hydrolase [Usitatibacteraceae bacterium]
MKFALHTGRNGWLLTIALLLGVTFALGANAAAGTGGKIVAEEYWTHKGSVKLWVYRKQVDDGVKDKPLLFLVHGSSYSSKTMYDLTVPDRVDYSFMDHFARLGFDVWTMDHEGYGHSDRTSGLSDIQSGVEDLTAAMGVVKKVTGKSKAVFFGQSSGALRAARFTNAHPENVEKLAIDAFVWTGKGAPTLADRAKRLPELLKSNVRKVDAKFYSSVFTRDHPGAAEPMMGDVVAEAELKYGNTVPNGTYIDMVTKLPLVDPEKIPCPVLILRSEHDGIATDEDLMGFFAKLPNPDKQMTKIAGLAHTAFLGVNRERFWHVLQAFLTMPPRVDLAGGMAPAAH